MVETSNADGAPAPEQPVKDPPKRGGPDPLIGRVINDRFRITGLIARGGMGKVYRAEQAPLGREVALKILNPNYHGDQDPEFHKRFFLEASICAKLTHPNTVTIFDYGRTDDDVYYIAMELLEGKTLHRALRENGRLEPDRAMHIARQMCRSLREAHALGVVHRDLKPANIFLVKHGDEQDFVKVLDFGLVKDLAEKSEDLTQTGLFMGSPKYMSPEQIRGEHVDHRCDIYALGVILYQMLTGKVPFDRPNSVNILMAHVHEQPPTMAETAPGAIFDPRLEQVVLKAMAKDPAERFDTMDAFLVELKHTAAETGLGVSRSGESALSREFALGGGSTGSFGSVEVTGTPQLGLPTGAPASSPSSSDAMAPPISFPDHRLGEPEDTSQRGRALLFIGGALLVAGLIGGYIALRSPSPPIATVPPATGQEVGQNPTQDPIQDPGPVEPAVARVLVSLRSEPSGALVQVGERTYGPTPADVEWTGADAAPGREITFQFQLEGHRDFTVTRTIITDALAVTAELDEATPEPSVMIRRPPRPRTPMGMVTMMSGGASVGIKGYKAEPY